VMEFVLKSFRNGLMNIQFCLEWLI